MNERVPMYLKWLIPIAVIAFFCIGAVVIFSGIAWLLGRANSERNPVEGLFRRQPAGQAAVQDFFRQEPDEPVTDLMVVPDEDGENNRFALTGRLLNGGANFITVAGFQIYTDENTSRLGTIENNPFVRVEGIVQPDGRLLASQVMPADGLEAYSGALRGVVESIDGNSLIISGVTVKTSNQTSIDRSIEPGTPVVVNGLVMQDGGWLAIDVSQDNERQVSDDVTGKVDNVDGEEGSDNGNETDPPLNNSFTYIGHIQNINPWNIAGREVQVNDSAQLAANLAEGELVRAVGVIREDGTWVANSIARQEAVDGQAKALVIGRIDDTNPWTINSLQLEVDEKTRISEGLEEGELVIAEVVIAAVADGENRWLAQSIQTFDSQLADNCFAVLDTIEHLDSGEIILRNWPAEVLEDYIDLNGKILEGAPVLATVCAQGDQRFTITRLVVLELVGERGEADDDNDLRDDNNNEGREDNDNQVREDNDNDNRDGNDNDNGNNNKVTICHYPPGNRDKAHTITVGEPAVEAHLRNHGDTLGPCP